jgi:hypothetical protein
MNQSTPWHCSLCDNPNPRHIIFCLTCDSPIQPWKKRKICQSLECDVCTPLLHLAPEKRRRTQTPYETKEWNSMAIRPTYTSPTMDQLNFITRIRHGMFQISELTATLHKNPELSNAKNHNSDTALMIAIWTNNLPYVQSLLSAHAHSDTQNNDGDTPLKMAIFQLFPPRLRPSHDIIDFEVKAEILQTVLHSGLYLGPILSDAHEPNHCPCALCCCRHNHYAHDVVSDHIHKLLRSTLDVCLHNHLTDRHVAHLDVICIVTSYLPPLHRPSLTHPLLL